LKYYKVSFDGAPPVKAAAGAQLSDFIGAERPPGERILAAYVDNAVCDLSTRITADCSVRFIGVLSAEGLRIYERSLIFTLAKAVRDLFPGRRLLIRHSVRFDIFFEIIGDSELLPEEIYAIERRMKELVAGRIPFKRAEVMLGDAVKFFGAKDRQDLYNAISERHLPHVVFYEFDGMTDYSYGVLAPDSDCLDEFSLIYRYPGAIMTMPRSKTEQARAEKRSMYTDVPKLLNVFAEYKNWGRILGIENIGELNMAARVGGAPDIIRVAEALQENKISQIADQIAVMPARRKIVLIAGPSSSGKTTFANRLSIQLRVLGFQTSIISMDDYYLNRADAPLDENGAKNFESPEALDIELFSSQMKSLVAGHTVKIPVYNFRKGRRDDHSRPLSVGDKHILLIEGIHGLNPKITASIPREFKHRIYISALTSLNIDDHNRIPTTDTRLIRRIVRDRLFRGASAVETIGMWPSVRAGEEDYIFPYQESCDSMFNSGLIYELGVMKDIAKPLLEGVGRGVPEYAEALRLNKFLSYFVGIQADDIPPNSILREFIGGSCFKG